MNGGGNVTVGEPKPVGPICRCWLVCKTEVVKRPIQPVTGTVARENAARSIASVGGRCETDNQEPCPDFSETRYGPAPVIPIPESPDLLPGNFLPIFDQARTSGAVEDLTLGLEQPCHPG